MQHNENSSKKVKPWYKRWWGIIIVIGLFPVTVPYLVWAKTTLNRWVKISITALCALYLIGIAGAANQQLKEAEQLLIEADNYIAEDKLNEALNALNKSEELNTDKKSNTAFALEDEINKFRSADFLKSTLINMSDRDFESLERGELETKFLSNTTLNKKFLDDLGENSGLRAIYAEETAKLKKEQEARAKIEERKKMIEKQFSQWDGSHYELTRLVKVAMNDPKSYEHVSTSYVDMNDYIIVSTTFRGTNAFGGIVTNIVKAKTSLEGQIIEIIE